MPSLSKRIRRRVTAGMVVQLSGLVSRLPLSCAKSLGRLLGSCAYHCRLGVRQQAESNLEHAYGQDLSLRERQQLTRRTLRHFGETMLESLVMHRWGPEKILERAQIEGLDEARAQIDAVLEGGKGVVLLTGHLGQWDLASCIGGTSWEPTAMVVRRFRMDGYQQVFDSIRRGFGAPPPIYQGDSIWSVAKVLRKNGVVGIAADQDTKRVPGTFVPFFGRPAYTPRGPSLLSLSVGSPIVIFVVVRIPGGYRAITSNPIEPNIVADEEDPNQALTSVWTRELENVIREYPEQWVWNHNRWRTTPERLLEREERQRQEQALHKS